MKAAVYLMQSLAQKNDRQVKVCLIYFKDDKNCLADLLHFQACSGLPLFSEAASITCSAASLFRYRVQNGITIFSNKLI